MSDGLYPALYHEASNASATGQSNFLRFVKVEYSLLALVSLSVLGQSKNFFYTWVTTLLFVILIVVTLWRAFSSPDRNWYHGRAVAESIKTLTWRFAMCAEPFQKAKPSLPAPSQFRNELTALLSTNKELGSALAAHSNTGEQLTSEMLRLRDLSIENRIEYYVKNRIDEQRAWYARKARANSRLYKLWIAVVLLLYGAGTAMTIGRAIAPDFTILPIDLIVVLAGCGLGWMQLKKFNELSASYGLTAAEIGIIKSQSAEIKTELQFVEFVKDSEFAFSREHTQWIARQSS
jgi:hypothetical protein